MNNEKLETSIDVQLCFTTGQKEILLELNIRQGLAIKDVIVMSKLPEICPEIDFSQCKLGIFGKIKHIETVLQAGDRIEIYRPLTADPMEARRRRSKKYTGK